MVISPEGLVQLRKSWETAAHEDMVRRFDNWLERWLTALDAAAYPLPYRIRWKKCWDAIARWSPKNTMVSPPGVIFDVLDKYKAEGWKISRDDHTEDWWIFKKRVDELVFDKQPEGEGDDKGLLEGSGAEGAGEPRGA